MEAPKYFNDLQKQYFNKIIHVLKNNGLFSDKYWLSIELLAVNMAQFQWSIMRINRLNNAIDGEGYIQTYESGAKAISVELTIKKKAEDSITMLLKQFGFDPKSEKDIKSIIEDGSEDAFENFRLKKVENK